MADVARGHGGDTYGRGPPGGGPPDDDRSWQPPRQCEVSDDSGSGSGSGRGQGKRGKTTLQGMRKRNPQGNLLTIEFEQGTHDTYKPVGANQATFASLVGTLVDKFPQNYKSWRKIPAELKATIWPDLKMYFDMTPHEGLRTGIEKYAANRYKDHKYRFKQKHFSKIGGEDRVDISDVVPPDMQESEWKGYVDYYTSPEVKARSETNKSNKGKQTIKGHGGRTSLAQCRYMFREVGSDEPGSAILAYRRFYTDSSGNFYQPEPAAYYEQMVALQQQHPEMSEKQFMRQVLGERPGWERGIGPIPSVPSQPPPPLHRTDQRMFSQAEVEEMIAARLASEQEQWQSQMMTNMMAQMQSQIQTQVQSALKKSWNSQQSDDENDEDGSS